jgi:hypothetical protein
VVTPSLPENIFWPVFGRFCPKTAFKRPPNLPANQRFSTAGFEFFAEISVGWQQWSKQWDCILFLFCPGFCYVAYNSRLSGVR